METIKVNMNPNPLDVQTIHASQNDTQREWSFEPFDNSGTLIIGEESLANIKRIKGNTLAFNQLLQNGNFASTSGWTGIRGGITASNNVLTYTCTEIGANIVNNRIQNTSLSGMVTGHNYYVALDINVPRQSKFVFQINGSAEPSWKYQQTIQSGWNRLGFAYNADVATYPQGKMWVCVDMHQGTGYSIGDTVQFKNIQLFDLTLMGLTADQFKYLFPLPYYSYQSTLLPFKGTGIKTVGKNLLDFYVNYGVNGSNVEITLNDGVLNVKNTSAGTYKGVRWDFYLSKGNYVFSYDAQIVSGSNAIEVYDMTHSATRLARLNENTTSGLKQIAFSVSEYIQVRIIVYCVFGTSGLGESNISNLQLEFGSSASSYEPYTSSTTDLPTLTYFPNGMKSAGNVYDELLPNKAITRVGMVNLGTLNWNHNANYGMFTSGIANLIKKPSSATVVANIVCANRVADTWSHVYNGGTSSGLCGVATDGSFGMSTTETDASTFKSAMNGVYLYYELKTPTETDINTEVFYPVYQYGTEQILPINGTNPTTSPFNGDIHYADGLKTDQTFLYRQTPINYNTRQFALVSKNTQTPLTLKDGKGYCNTPLALTNESGFFDAKLKMTDSDGVCYSEKFQIHVERRP